MKRRGRFYPDLYVIKILLLHADGHSKRGGVAIRREPQPLSTIRYLKERGFVTGDEELRLTPRGAEAAARLAELIKELTGEELRSFKRR